MHRLLLFVTVLCACGRDPIAVYDPTAEDTADFGRTELLAAVDAVAKDPTSPTLVRALADEIERVRPMFNKPVEKEAERTLAFLAIGPVEALYTSPIEEQFEKLALTVWPIALRVEPTKGETAAQYAERLCANELALDCKHVVPRFRPAVLSATVWRRFKERAREAYSACRMCRNDTSYDVILERYDDYQTKAEAEAAITRKRAHPNQWPKAGPSSRPWLDQPLLELLGDGSAEFKGKAVDTEWRRAIAEGRGDVTILGLHLRPTDDVRLLRSVIADARKAGYQHIDLETRLGEYPYERRSYRLAVAADRGARRVSVQDVDSIQILVQALDAAAAHSAEDEIPLLRL